MATCIQVVSRRDQRETPVSCVFKVLRALRRCYDHIRHHFEHRLAKKHRFRAKKHRLAKKAAFSSKNQPKVLRVYSAAIGFHTLSFAAKVAPRSPLCNAFFFEKFRPQLKELEHFSLPTTNMYIFVVGSVVG